MQTGITTSVLAGANAPRKPDGQSDVLTDENGNVIEYDHVSDSEDGTVELESEEANVFHPAHEAICFQHHRQEGKGAVVRGLPAKLATNPLRAGRRSK